MKKYSLLLILSLFLFASCEKEANIKILKVEPKLVINSFINENSTFSVSVELSKAIYNNVSYNLPTYVENAQVTISDGTTTHNLIHSSYGMYYNSVPFQYASSGKTYHLTVSTPDGKSVTASTTVPKPVNQGQILYSITPTNNVNEYNLKISFQDSYYTGDYYILKIENENDDEFESSILISDIEVDNDQWITKNFKVKHEPNEYLFCIIYHISKEYYEFNKKLETIPEAGNPFAEPVQMYTNINGGFGIFGGSSYTDITIFP